MVFHFPDSVAQQTTYEEIPSSRRTATKADLFQPPKEPTLLSTATTPKLFTTQDPTIRESCTKRLAFHVHDKVATQGGVNMEVFEMGGSTYLAAANFHLPKAGFVIDSLIYKMNPATEKFELLQKLLTAGCRSITYFSDRGNSYLVAANHYDGKTYVLDSVIYKWNGSRFLNYTKVKTEGASATQFFRIGGESFLVFANYRNITSVSVFSVVYKWTGRTLDVFQKLQTHGAVDCKFYRTKAGQILLVFASYYQATKEYNTKSIVYKWDGNRFVVAQNLEVSAAMGVDLFESKDGLFLALASHRTANSWHSHSTIFRWNGTAFLLFQELETAAAAKVIII